MCQRTEAERSRSSSSFTGYRQTRRRMPVSQTVLNFAQCHLEAYQSATTVTPSRDQSRTHAALPPTVATDGTPARADVGPGVFGGGGAFGDVTRLPANRPRYRPIGARPARRAPTNQRARARLKVSLKDAAAPPACFRKGRRRERAPCRRPTWRRQPASQTTEEDTPPQSEMSAKA